jgi:hypothetical protein
MTWTNNRSFYRFGRVRACTLLAGLADCALLLCFRAVALAQASVTTYHNDPQRTGWNASETILTPANVTLTTFGLIATVALDDQVDTQPLVVANQPIAGQGVHTVVYVATENDTVYAIDAFSGKILVSNHLGAPTLTYSRPCPLDRDPNIGINGTPTIDVGNQAIYLVARILISGQPTFQLHALSLQTLQDLQGSPVNISASNQLTNNSVVNFNSSAQRQRPALLEWGGTIYAAFGSVCEGPTNEARGWLLGWNAQTLTPLASNELTNTLSSGPTPSKGENYFMSSIWMSGYGVAADSAGNIYFTTGNSDPYTDTYTGTTNIQESAVRMSPTLTGVSDFFTPANVYTLDQNDLDFGSGGIMVVPAQPGPVPYLAVAAGKDGRLFILNRASLGGFNNPDIPARVWVGYCWCGPSYYQGSDGVGRVVSSGGNTSPSGAEPELRTWKINTAANPALTQEAFSLLATTSPSQDPGFFTSISSNGTAPNTAIIWAIDRPTGSDNHITLYAFNGTPSQGKLPLLWSGSAGFWPYTGADSDLVPTVANGMVYVASYQQLAIFGLITPSQSKAKLLAPAPLPMVKSSSAEESTPRRPAQLGGSNFDLTALDK